LKKAVQDKQKKQNSIEIERKKKV